MLFVLKLDEILAGPQSISCHHAFALLALFRFLLLLRVFQDGFEHVTIHVYW